MDNTENNIDIENMNEDEYEQYMQINKTIDNLDDTITSLNQELCDEKCQMEENIKKCRQNQFKTTDEYVNCENLLRDYRNNYGVNINEDDNIFNKEIEELIYDLKYNHETTKEEITQFISDYETSLIYYNKLLTLYNKINKENTLYDEKIDNYTKIVNTSDRMTFYEDENIISMNNKKYILLIIYWGLLLYLIYKLLYINKQYKNVNIIIELVILFIIPIYGLKYIKQFIFYTYNKIKLVYYKYISFK